MRGLEDSFASEDEFSAGVVDYALSRLAVTVITYTGWKAASEGAVTVFLGSDRPGARVHVSGSDRRWVDGTIVIIRETIERVALRPRSEWASSVVGGIAIMAEVVAFLAYASVVRTGHATAVAAVAGAIFAVSLAYVAGSVGLLGRLVPKFRLVSNDVEAPSARRLKLLKRAAGTLLVLVLGAVISALINKWIN